MMIHLRDVGSKAHTFFSIKRLNGNCAIDQRLIAFSSLPYFVEPKCTHHRLGASGKHLLTIVLFLFHYRCLQLFFFSPFHFLFFIPFFIDAVRDLVVSHFILKQFVN